MPNWFDRVTGRSCRKADAAPFHLLGSLTDALAECVIGIRLDGTVGLWNPGAHRLTGYIPRDVLARPMEDIFAAAHRQEIGGLLL